jgi:competence protein ComFC
MWASAAPVKSWLNTGLGFFYPEICQLCENEHATARDGFVGAKCWTQIRFIRPPFCARCGLPFQGDLTTKFECTNCREMELHFSSARSAVVAKTVVLEAIHRFKYLRHLWFENFLADLLIREAGPELRGQKWDFIVPVPLHSLKQREREFNQAEILARHLSAAKKFR